MPVTSPIAHSRSPARSCASTGMPCGPASTPTVSRPMPVTRGPAAGGDQQPVAAQLAAVVQDQHVVLAVAPGGGRLRAEGELDPVPAQHLAERLAQRRRLAGQHPVAAGDERDLAAEPADRLRHLDADRPAAEHQQPARDRLHAGHLAVGPHPVQLAQPRHRRDDRRRRRSPATTCRAVCRTPSTSTDAGAGQPAAAAQQLDALGRQPVARRRRRSSPRP